MTKGLPPSETFDVLLDPEYGRLVVLDAAFLTGFLFMNFELSTELCLEWGRLGDWLPDCDWGWYLEGDKRFSFESSLVSLFQTRGRGCMCVNECAFSQAVQASRYASGKKLTLTSSQQSWKESSRTCHRTQAFPSTIHRLLVHQRKAKKGVG